MVGFKGTPQAILKHKRFYIHNNEALYTVPHKHPRNAASAPLMRIFKRLVYKTTFCKRAIVSKLETATDCKPL